MEKIIIIYIPKEKLIFLLYKDPLEIRKKTPKEYEHAIHIESNANDLKSRYSYSNSLTSSKRNAAPICQINESPNTY